MRWTVLAAIALAAWPALAADPGERWRQELVAIDQLLHQHDYARAQPRAVRLIDDMNDKIGSGQNAAYTFAVAVAFRALAEAGLGRHDDADWYWHVALGLYPPYETSNLAVYGEPGEWLMKYKEREPALPRASEDRKVRPPKLLRRKLPEYPEGAKHGGVADAVTLELVVDVDGAFRRPLIVNGKFAPGLVYTALEAMRQWTFEPATVDGKPVPILWHQKMDFTLGR